MKYDLFFIVSLVINLLIFSLTLRLAVKEKKTELYIASIAAAFSILTLFFTTWKDDDNSKELKRIYEDQNILLRDTLIKQINILKRDNDSLQKKVVILSKYERSSTISNQGSNNNNIIGNDNSHIIISSQEKPKSEKTIEVNSITNSKVYVKKGDKIFISASSSIKLGPFAGHSGPDGKESGFMGGNLSDYNIVESFKHGALIFRYSDESDWVYCGSSYKFTAQQNGYLTFQINDIRQSDNTGAYKVTISIYN